jgi:hypothetical protein
MLIWGQAPFFNIAGTQFLRHPQYFCDGCVEWEHFFPSRPMANVEKRGLSPNQHPGWSTPR